MKKIAIIFLSATILSSASFASDDVLATYKGGEVRESQVMEQFKPMLDAQDRTKEKKFSDLDKTTQEALVRAYVNMQLLSQEAKAQNIENNQEYKKKIDNFKLQLMQQTVIENYLKTAVTEDMVNKAYDNLAGSLKEQKEIKIAHILIVPDAAMSKKGEDEAKKAQDAAEKKAQDIRKKINNNGSNFADIAKKFSSDEETKASGGELGYVLKGQLVSSVSDAAFALKKNEISQPVRSEYGYHIIKVLDSRSAKVPSKEEAKSSIVAQLNREAIEKYFADLSLKSDVKLNLTK